MTMIDLRSDTVTRPSAAMRAAMAAAPVGDDQYGEDPAVNELQAEVASLLGKEAALFMASGTMANQVALKLFTRPGDDVIVSQESHAVWHEAGASGANAGVQFTPVGKGGLFTAADLVAAFKAPGHAIFPATTLVEVENTHNRGGGLVFPQSDVEAICTTAAKLGAKTFLDGARLFNAAVASGATPAALAAPFDLVSIALSKGLGAPIGSVLAGRKDDIARAQRFRRMFGGALRQAGIIAAAGTYALRNNLGRLGEDHAHARLIAEAIADSPKIRLDLKTVQTNIVVFHLNQDAPEAAAIVAAARERGVLVLAFAKRTVRAVTHLDVTRADCVKAGETLRAILDGL